LKTIRAEDARQPFQLLANEDNSNIEIPNIIVNPDISGIVNPDDSGNENPNNSGLVNPHISGIENSNISLIQNLDIAGIENLNISGLLNQGNSFLLDENAPASCQSVATIIFGQFNFEEFEIPYPQFGTTINEKLTSQQFLNPDDLEVITRVLVDEMRRLRRKFGRVDCRIVVRKMSRQYPESFLVKNMNNVLDPESDIGLVTKLTNRNNYCERRILADQNTIKEQPKPTLGKRKLAQILASTTAQWNPPRPDSENSQSIAAKQAHLNKLYTKRSALSKEEKSLVQSYMACTFADQRCFLNQLDPLPSMNDITEQWPFLFEMQYLYQHFDTLTGTPIANLKNNLENMYDQIIDYAKTDKKSRAFFVKDTSSNPLVQCIKALAFMLNDDVDLLMKNFQVSFHFLKNQF
jgi:hypothetical protein